MSRLPAGGLEVFLAVAEQRSLRAAARALGVQPPAVSARLKALEEQIGVSLFARTTRSVRLTDAGRRLLKRARPAMAELGEAVEEARGMGKTRQGTIRITLPYFAYELAIAPHLADFQRQHPAIELELSFDEALVDVVAEGFHAGVRIGDRIQEDMIAVRLTPPLKTVCFVSPAYLERHGRPERPQDLLRHNCIRYRYIASKRIAAWPFKGGINVDARGSLIVNSTTALLEAARSGLGIGWLFRQNVADDLRSHRLVSVLDEFAVERPGLFLYYPKGNSRLEMLRAFIEAMRERKTAERDPPAPRVRTMRRRRTRGR
jgi:DNA-binding transcriptional LysR family regulator